MKKEKERKVERKKSQRDAKERKKETKNDKFMFMNIEGSKRKKGKEKECKQ